MKTQLAALVLTAPLAIVSISTPAQSHDEAGVIDPVVATSCHTSGRITQVDWSDGFRSAQRDITAKAFPGSRMRVRNPKVWNKPDWVVRCVVNKNLVRLWTKNGAKWLIIQAELITPLIVTSPQKPLVPTGPPPPSFAQWTTPITISSQLDESWGVPSVVAAWNTALPADRQITLTDVPCPTALQLATTCIPIEAVETIPGHPEWYGVAHPYHTGTLMERCDIQIVALGETFKVNRAAQIGHEIGHCLGLPHWEDFAGAVMSTYNYAPEGSTGLPTQYDLTWLAASYAG